MSSILLKPNSTVKLIEIDINSGNLTDFTARHVGLFIQNYQGSIKFNNNVVFENGRIPVIDGYDTLLSISVKKEADVSITITQKTMSTRN
jgi:redox-sensitive bicupin YhaK (pirin superfamily)